LLPCHRLGPDCKGNRLEWVPGSSKQKLLASFPHHKNEARWDHLPIEFELPPSLTHTIMPWVVEGHAIVAPNSRVLFVQPSTGGAMSNVNLSQWFQKMLGRFEAPFRFAPSNLRHIFVDDMCSGKHVAGPDHNGAARIMGNSVERWAISYDRNMHSRQVQAAVQAMEGWRQELLSLPGSK
jgi:hypothetical protein